MKILRCPRCGQKGFLTLRYTKYYNLRYPYVGHYNPNKKSKRSWCLVKESQIKSLKVNRFWQYKYYKAIAEGVDLREKTDDSEVWKKPFEIAKKLLEKHGYLRTSIWSKIVQDLIIEEKRRNLKKHYPSKKPKPQQKLSKEEQRNLHFLSLAQRAGVKRAYQNKIKELFSTLDSS